MVGFSRKNLPAPTTGDPFLIQLCCSCLSQDQSQRPPFSEIVQMLDKQYGPPGESDWVKSDHLVFTGGSGP